LVPSFVVEPSDLVVNSNVRVFRSTLLTSCYELFNIVREV